MTARCVSKLFVEVGSHYLFSLRCSPKKPRKDHRLELMGGRGEPGESPLETLVRELGEEEISGTLAGLAGEVRPEARVVMVKGEIHHLFHLNIGREDLSRLMPHPKESYGYYLVPKAVLEPGSGRVRAENFTPKTLKIFRALNIPTEGSMSYTTIKYSAELRWFFTGNMPGTVTDWIGMSLARGGEHREDRYLLIPGCESSGVKARQGKFEIKSKVGDDRDLEPGPGLAGVSDCWAKWSQKTAWVKDCARDWLPVRKNRIQKKVDLGPDETAPAKPDGKEPVGLLEIVEIEVEGNPWWSLCCEAHGSLDVIRPRLDRLMAHVAGLGRPPLDFGMGHSLSYPGWLSLLMNQNPDLVKK